MQEQVTASHAALSPETENACDWLNLLLFYSVQDPSPWEDVTHISSSDEPLWEQSYSRPDQRFVPR